MERSALPHATKLAQLRTLYHDPQGYGENLYSYAGSKLPEPFNVDPGAVKGWYGEVACYCGYETAYPPCVTGMWSLDVQKLRNVSWNLFWIYTFCFIKDILRN